jgi:hypothetical protein
MDEHRISHDSLLVLWTGMGHNANPDSGKAEP